MNSDELIKQFFYQEYSDAFEAISSKERFGYLVITFQERKTGQKLFVSLKPDGSGIHII